MTHPIRDPKRGAVLHPGRYYPGSEPGWGGVAGPSPSGESHEGMRKIVFTPAWDYHAINVPADVERAVKADKGLLYGGEPDLSRFFTRGGKLLMYHGWADPLVSPDTSLLMFKRINDSVGASAANSLALFMVPGMGHCQGGPGTDVFDKAAAIDQWVLTGKKPQSIEAAHMTAGIVDRTRPLCAYPMTRTTTAPTARMMRRISGVSRRLGAKPLATHRTENCTSWVVESPVTVNARPYVPAA